MKISNVLLLSALLISCGTREVVTLSKEDIEILGIDTKSKVDAKLLKYVLSFEDNLNVLVNNISISVGDASYAKKSNSGSSVGVCMVWFNKTTKEILKKEILINPKFYDLNKDSDTKMEILMFHELLHCTHKVEHNNKTIMPDGSECDMTDNSANTCKEGRPVSIMRWFIFNDDEINNYYIPNRQEYIQEMKSYIK